MIALCAAGYVWYAPARAQNAAPSLTPLPSEGAVATTTMGLDNPAASLRHYADLTVVSGTVESVGASSITLKGNTSDAARTTVNVASDASVVRIGKEKDPAAYQAELDAFRQKLRYADGSSDTYIAPLPYEVQTISLSDVRAGDTVTMNVSHNVAVEVTIITSK